MDILVFLDDNYQLSCRATLKVYCNWKVYYSCKMHCHCQGLVVGQPLYERQMLSINSSLSPKGN